MKIVIFITARTERTLEVAQAWQQAGASGVTILEGHGLRRLQENLGARDDLPLIPSLASLLRQQEISTHVLMSVVPDSLARQLSRIVVAAVGDLKLPDNGFVFTLDVGDVEGLRDA